MTIHQNITFSQWQEGNDEDEVRVNSLGTELPLDKIEQWFQ